jgi:hypothetical protein
MCKAVNLYHMAVGVGYLCQCVVGWNFSFLY